MGQTWRSGGFAGGTCDRCGENFKRAAKGQPYKFCSAACAMEPLWDRLMKRLEGSFEPAGCLVWTGKKHPDGYGEIQHDGRIWRVHRLMWKLCFGEIGEGLQVCHKCDNPACARPDHLFLGTHTDNMRDMARKGRGVTPRVRGENHGAAKLTVEHARSILCDNRPQRVIAEHYGISQGLVSQIKTGKIWRHIHGRAAA